LTSDAAVALPSHSAAFLRQIFCGDHIYNSNVMRIAS
jgi:hypothetical protein